MRLFFKSTHKLSPLTIFLIFTEETMQ